MREERIDGQETPYWKMGPFKVRLPFVDYRLEWPDYFQGLLMCAVRLSRHSVNDRTPRDAI